MVELECISTMGLNIKNPEVERLAAEVAEMANESKTEAIRQALLERRIRLKVRGRKMKAGSLSEYLETKVWPLVPPGELGRRMTREEEDEILGYGPDGY